MSNTAKEKIWELIARKLSGEASELELLELQRCLQQHAEEAYSLEIMEDLWRHPIPINRQYTEHQFKALTQKMQNLGINVDGFKVEDEHLTEVDESNEKYTQKSWIKTNTTLIAAVSFFTIILISALFYSKYNSKQTDAASTAVAKKSEITTKYGSKTTVVLPDGTKVWVNAGSKLSYDNNFGNKLREVALLGEAFFDVTHNAEKPFIIHTSKMDIKVLGTAFNVRCYPDENKMETSLLRGSIEVTLKDRYKEKIYLKPNEKLTLINDQVIQSKNITLNKAKQEFIAAKEPIVAISHLTYQPVDSTVIETSWVENKLIFRGETFEEVARKMEKWYGINIIISNEKLKEAHLTGSFEKETIDQALAALQITTPFKFVNNKNSIIITK